MKLSLKTILSYFVVSIIFSDALTFLSFFSFADFRVSYLMIGIFLLIILFSRRIAINKTFCIFMGIITLSSLYNIYIGKDTFLLLTKQVVGIAANALTFYSLMKFNDYNVEKLFKIYLNIAFLVALIGLLQEVSYLLGWKYGFDFHSFLPYWKVSLTNTASLLRVNSIINEPADFCYVMMPACFVSIASFTKIGHKFISRRKAAIIIVALLLTFSTVGYLGIILSFFLLVYNYGKLKPIIAICILIFFFSVFVYQNIAETKTRVDDSLAVLTGNVNWQKINLSSYAFFTNLIVACNSFKENPLFGSGLGSHEVSYNRFIHNIIGQNGPYLDVNSSDANSLFLRLLSETGLFGILVLAFFIIRFYVHKKKDLNGYLWIISSAILSMFFIRGLRQGHYFVNGFFFFIWMYYFAKLNLKQLLDTQAGT